MAWLARDPFSCAWGAQGPMLKRAPHSEDLTPGFVLKYSNISEQGALHFHFALYPTNYVASAAQRSGLRLLLVSDLGVLAPYVDFLYPLQRLVWLRHIAVKEMWIKRQGIGFRAGLLSCTWLLWASSEIYIWKYFYQIFYTQNYPKHFKMH